MARIKPLSGFPEWQPEQQLIEQYVTDHLRSWFERFGFSPIQTRAVEPLEVLLQKGETDKEIYTVGRLQGDGEGGEARLGLHYDLTVPFARYVTERRGDLSFPFKRYQIQKSWRGERPQAGRFREFLQADIDVIMENELPLAFDAEIPRLVHAVLSDLPLPAVRLLINNRKLMEGFYRGLGIDAVAPVLREVDKLDKIDADGVRARLTEQGLADGQIDACLALSEIRSTDASFVERVRELGVAHDLLDRGLDELAGVIGALDDLPEGAVVADLRIARGFDYYTGTIYEGLMVGHEKLGTVCAGGRYDDLAGGGGKVRLPGIGISIGVTRILSKLFADGLIEASRPTPTVVMVAVPSDDLRSAAEDVAAALRERKINCEVFHRSQKNPVKMINQTVKRGIPFVWFPWPDGHEVKDVRSQEQVPADPATWTPPAADMRIAVCAAEKP